jgi:hypothetical protein
MHWKSKILTLSLRRSYIIYWKLTTIISEGISISPEHQKILECLKANKDLIKWKTWEYGIPDMQGLFEGLELTLK